MNFIQLLFRKRQKKEKVFCIDCKFLKWIPKSGDYDFYCSNESLAINTYSRDSYLSRGTGKVIDTELRKCSSLNAKNDCFWFKPKEENNDFR